MRVDFIKMHGLGNDFIVLDARQRPLPPLTPAQVRALADRRRGIGCDQLVLLEPAAPAEAADCTMRIFNQDGGEVEACGNAARAVGLLLGQPARIATRGGVIATHPDGAEVAVDMGVPRFGWDEIPLAYALDTLTLPLAWDGLERPAAVNVGNPHLVFFVADHEAVPLEQLGPMIEHDPLFPARINVNVATIADRRNLHLRVWERGAGLTRACGTGACATAVAAMRRGLAERTVTVHLPGGALQVAWGSDGRICMRGQASEAFRGSFAWEAYA